jgi:glycyl-tRNA synthetase (class II)
LTQLRNLLDLISLATNNTNKMKTPKAVLIPLVGTSNMIQKCKDVFEKIKHTKNVDFSIDCLSSLKERMNAADASGKDFVVIVDYGTLASDSVVVMDRSNKKSETVKITEISNIFNKN